MIRKLRNIILILIASMLLLTATSIAVVYFYRTEIIQLFIEKANRNINTPVDVETIELNIWDQFPAVTFELTGVNVHESTLLAGDYLCRTEKICFSFDIFQLIFGQYVLKALSLEKATINMATGENGLKNYALLPPRDSGPEALSSPDFSIQTIMLKEVDFNYHDVESGIRINLFTEQLNNHIRKRKDNLIIRVTGKVRNRDLLVNETSFLKAQELMLLTGFEYGLTTQILTFDESTLEINGHQYQINGEIMTGEEKRLDLHLGSKKNNIQALLALIPEKWGKKLSAYRSKGDIDFSGSLTGSFKDGDSPLISAIFTCKDVTFFYPGYEKTLQDLNFTGKFTNGISRNMESSRLEINNFRGRIDEHKVEGNLVISDLKRLNTTLDLNGTLDLNAFLKTFPVEQITHGSGMIDFGLQLRGMISELKDRKPSAIRTSGQISLKNVNFRTWFSDLSFSGINGDFFFNNMDLAIQDFSGTIGKSDLRLSGMFKNIIPFLLYKNKPLRIEADLRSGYLDLNELFTLNFNDQKQPVSAERKYHLGISPKLNLDFNCSIKQADLKRFHGESISGKLSIRDQIATVEDVSMNTMGGKLFMSGSVMARHPVEREFLVDGTLESIYIDSVFYVFNNFNQKFLVNENLRGQVNATVNTYFKMDDNLHFNSSSLDTYVEVRIKKGQLMQFEPIHSLSIYLRNEDLTNVRFSDLQNNIRISDRTVYIPEMEIISSEYRINVSGEHTFDQVIDYHFRIPLDQFHRDDPDQRFGRIAEGDKGPPNLFLKMTGTAVDYQVSYDTRAVKEKVKDDLKREGKEIKELFKRREENTEKQLELEEDEYIDFKNN